MKLLGFNTKKIGAWGAGLILAIIGFLVGIIAGLALGGFVAIAILLMVVIFFQVGTLLLIQSLWGQKEPKT